MASVAEAPAKIILLGEHFCVYGAPAISMAVTLYTRVKVSNRDEVGLRISSPLLHVSGVYRGDEYSPEVGGEGGKRLLDPLRMAVKAVLDYVGSPTLDLDVEVNSEIPLGVGLGSSASVSVATITAVAQHLGVTLTRGGVCELAYTPERHVHYNPSGIDQTTTTYGGLILFQSGKPIEALKPKKPLFFVIGDTGIKRSTGDVVRRVGEAAKERRAVMDEALNAARNLTMEAVKVIEEGNLPRLGSLMDENQELLSAIGVSHKMLDLYVEVARNAGVLGAKLTGAGGGGCMIALTNPEKIEEVADAIRGVGGKTYNVKMDNRGVSSWTET